MAADDEDVNRLGLVRSVQLLSGVPDSGFDHLTSMAAHLCAQPTSLVALLEPIQQHLVSNAVDGHTGTVEASAFCAAALATRDRESVFEVSDALLDERFRNDELVTKHEGVRFYAGVPLVAQNEQWVGTLCVLGTEPSSLTAEQKTALVRLARIAEQLLHLQLLTAARANLLKVITEHEQALTEMQLRRARAVRNLAHDLSTPLAAIRITTESLRLQNPPAPFDTQINALVDFAADADSLLRDLRLINSPDNDDPILLTSRQPLAPLVERAATGLFTLLSNDTLELRLDELHAQVDEHAIHRIVTNLLAHTVTQNPVGAHVTIDLRSNGTDVVIEFADISPELLHRERPIDVGVQIETATKLVLAHGGTIDVSDHPEAGRVVRVTLPSG